MLSPKTLHSRLKAIRLVVSDVDGVLTDGGITIDSLGHESKCFSAQDGMGLSMARLGGLQTAFLSARESKIVTLRAQECGVSLVMQGKKQKAPAFLELCLQARIQPSAALYIGDDLLDLPVFDKTGIAVAVSSAAPEVKKAAHYITKIPGGQGAVREVIELIMRVQGTWPKALAQVLGRNVAKT